MDYALRGCFQHALKRLDLLLHREVLRLRASYQLSLDEFRGLYISDNQVDALVREWVRAEDTVHDAEDLTRQAQALTRASREQLAGDRSWSHVVHEFGLNAFEQDVLLLALAPELTLKYETLYAYLNNDVTRKHATVDMALRVFRDEDPEHARATLSPAGALFAEQLLENAANGNSRFSLSLGFVPAPSLVNYLLGPFPTEPHLLYRAEYQPPQTPDWEGFVVDKGLRRQLQGLPRLWKNPEEAPWVVLQGEAGSGRMRAARMALGAAEKGMFTADLSALTQDENELLAQIERLLLQARLTNAGLFLRGLDRVMTGEARERRAMTVVLNRLAAATLPVFLALPPNLPWRDWLRVKNSISLQFEEPSAPDRKRLWDQALAEHDLVAAEADRYEAADRFQLNAGQISAAALTLKQQRQLRSNGKDTIVQGVLFAAAREQSVCEIGKLAQKLPMNFCWDDLVLPQATRQRIREIVAAIRHRDIVYREWGMQRRVGGLTGLAMLFSGASGTGKTMSASIIAQEIGLDLYRIDLSGIVSKYIGETEKNLDRIFTAARRANCILFFDEADALFGKRSEVKDAHDRYANIEVAYLLLKIEEHEGIVILATNIARNLDQAFSRRLHYIVEFPRPDAKHRQQLWQGMFATQTPLAEDVDFDFLARQFDTTGGDIKTVALDAAMLAASNGRLVTMACLVKAMSRQMIKQGKVPSSADFKHYYAQIG